MNQCRITKHYRGTKAEVIKEMITDQEKAKLVKKIPHIVNRGALLPGLRKLQGMRKKQNKLDAQQRELGIEIERMSEAFDKAITKWDDRLHLVGYSRSSDSIPSVEIAYNSCLIPDEVLDKLEKADTLRSLRKTKESRELEQEIIDEYKLEP
jgi:hypothetical protein